MLAADTSRFHQSNDMMCLAACWSRGYLPFLLHLGEGMVCLAVSWLPFLHLGEGMVSFFLAGCNYFIWLKGWCAWLWAGCHFFSGVKGWCAWLWAGCHFFTKMRSWALFLKGYSAWSKSNIWNCIRIKGVYSCSPKTITYIGYWYCFIVSRGADGRKPCFCYYSIWMSTPKFKYFCVPVMLKWSKYGLIHGLEFMCSIAGQAKKNNIIGNCSIHNARMKMAWCTIKY